MNSTVNVYFLPDLVPENALIGSTAVVIDILRATTTMTCGLAAGASRIIPCVGIDEAHRTRDRLAQESQPVLLGGERQGKPLPGFDLGNSPASYDPATVGDKTVVMTTTNGTRAMSMCREADEIVIGSFANFSRVVAHLQKMEVVSLVCSGTHRHVTSEDVLFAGAVAQALAGNRMDQTGLEAGINDQARMAIAHWWQLCQPGQQPSVEQLELAFQQSLGGSNLVRQDRGPDLRYAAEIDRHENLPILNQERWEIQNA